MSFLSGIFNNVSTPDVTYTGQSGITKSTPAPGDLSGLTNGETISGKVLSNNNGNITIELPGGTQIQAKLSDQVSLSEGQEITFEYKGISDNKIVLSPLYTNVSNASTAMKALSAASLPINDLTMSMADSMIEAGKNINKDALVSMYRDVSAYKNSEPQNIMAMKEMGIELNPENVQKFEAFKNYENKLTEGIKDIVRDIPSAFNEILNESGENKAAGFINDVIRIFTEGSMPEDGDGQSVGTNEPLVGKIVISENGPVLEQDSSGNNPSSNGVSNVDINGTPATPMPQVADGANALDANNINRFATIEGADAEQQGNSNTEQIQSREPLQNGEQLQSLDTWKNMTTFEKSGMIDALKQAGMPEEATKRLFDENVSSTDFLKSVATTIQKGSLTDSIRELISSDKFGAMLKDAVDKQWTLEPAQVQDKAQVEHLYERLERQTRDLTDALSKAVSESTSGNTPLQADLSNMNQNMDFMHQMNNVYQYVQLPLKMNGSDATGDLYVFTDKKSLANSDGNVSALLHLDMSNLGPVDVYASITPGNNVFTKFYLKDDEMIDFISNNIHILNERLENRGYSTKAEMVIKGSDKNEDVAYDVLHAGTVGGQVGNTSLVSKLSFDMRA